MSGKKALDTEGFFLLLLFFRLLKERQSSGKRKSIMSHDTFDGMTIKAKQYRRQQTKVASIELTALPLLGC